MSNAAGTIPDLVFQAVPTFWENPARHAPALVRTASAVGTPTWDDVLEAEARLARFAPLVARLFPQTRNAVDPALDGIIESPLVAVPHLRAWLRDSLGSELPATPTSLLAKLDCDLVIAGSVKARGGIYEVLKHTEDLALEAGLVDGPGSDYARLADDDAREVFARHSIQVGSTGNLGMSIGIMSAALGYRAVVHMSSDAKRWKKDLLRAAGVTVVEYAGDYGEAVREGRARSEADPMSHFVDDENSKDLFCGYAVAALRLRRQLDELGIRVDTSHPLMVYLPCGVGGAPGGITFGLRHVFGDALHAFFVEPTQAPCMLVGLASGRNAGISVQDVGLTGQTAADGLAVGRPSGFVGGAVGHMIAGEFTVADAELPVYQGALWEAEGIFAEPSATAAIAGPARLLGGRPQDEAARTYLRHEGLLGEDGTATPALSNATHIIWLTGGSLVPSDVRAEMLGNDGA